MLLNKLLNIDSAIVGLCLFFLFLLSCTRVTDLKPEGRGEVVVVCILTEESTQLLTLDLTDIASQEDLSALSEAEITLFDETTGQEVGRFRKGDGEDWTLEYAAIPEHAYFLQVSIPGWEIITAMTAMPSKSNIAYRFRFMDAGVSYDINSLPEGPIWVMGMNHDYYKTGIHKPAEKMATSLTTVDPFNVTGEVFHAFDYYKELAQYAEAGKGNDFFYPFVEGQPLYDKMFRIPSVKEKQRVAEEPVVNNELESGSEKLQITFAPFSVAGYLRTAYYPYEYEGEPRQIRDTDGYILFVSPSEEYDRYLREVSSLKMQRQAMMDYASLFSRKNVYTNIINGLGVFGARTDQKLPWNDQPIRYLL